MAKQLRLIVVLLGTLALLTSVGCNTVRGVGKDVETAGKAIQRGSDEAKD